jgi:putative redox protein
MITVKTEYIGELRTKAEHQKSKEIIITDAPPDNKGKGEAFSPTDMLATALGSCMLTIMGISARAHGFSIDGAKADITKIMASNPRRVAEVKIDLFFPPNNYSEKEKKFIELAAYSCPVSQSLHPDLKQTITFNFA